MLGAKVGLKSLGSIRPVVLPAFDIWRHKPRPECVESPRGIARRARPRRFLQSRRALDEAKPPTQAAVSVAFHRLRDRFGLTGISHHMFRHTGASIMNANGFSLRAIQEIGGWTSLRMVERYTSAQMSCRAC
jgi:integrase